MSAIRRTLILLLLLASSAVSAQVFWSMSDEQGRQNWILGTLHSEDPRLLDWRAPLVEALQQADRLAVELVPDPSTLHRLQRSMVFDDERRLGDLLDADLHERVLALLKSEYGLSESAADRMRPWAVAVTLATPPAETGMFMDLMLSNRARGAGLEVVALETFEEQIDFLAGFDADDQIAMIRQAVEQHDRHVELFERLISAYLDGDLARLEHLAAEQMVGLPRAVEERFQETGLATRNRRMLERSEPWLEAGGLIIAVGALHLPGEEGLLAMLRDRGWKLEAIY